MATPGERARWRAWLLVAVGCLLLPPPTCVGNLHSFSDNTGILSDNTNVDYDGLRETVVRLVTDTTTLSATRPPFYPRVTTPAPAPAPVTAPPTPHYPTPTDASSSTTTPAPPRIAVEVLGNATRVEASCSGGAATITSSRGVSTPVKVSAEAETGVGALEVDLGTVEVGEESTLVAVDAPDCAHVSVVGGLPSSASTLTVSTSGVLALAPGWSSEATELWVRAAGGLETTADDLCALVPPTLQFLDISRTPVGDLSLTTSCAPITRIEAAHAALTSVSLCTPTLTTLHVSSNAINGSLAWAACEGGVAGVELLQANHNELTSASTCSWASLKTLDLSRNHLSVLDLTTCPPANLTKLTAARNHLTTPPVLTPTILHLDLSRNSLNELPVFTTAIMTADFSHNAILEVGKHRLKRARKLLNLNLAYNHLTHIHEHDLNGLRELRTLDVRYNRLREVSAGSFRHLRHLRRLHLQHNHLTTLDARDLAVLTPHTHASLHHNPWACTCSLLAALQDLQNCVTCHHQIVGVECKERGEWVAAQAVLSSCMKAVREVTQRLQNESDEDLSEEDMDDDFGGRDGKNGGAEGAVMVVPGLVVLLVAAVALVLGYRLLRKHRRTVRATLEPFCCGCCGAGAPVTSLGNNNHHSMQHRHLPNADNDSDTETEL